MYKTFISLCVGEISAGKSSFLNLLLEGQDFQLPQSEQETTSCICEIKYGQERSFIAHRADPRRGEETSVKIEPPTTDKLDKIVNVRYHQEVGKSLPKYKRVEIFVPLEFLEVTTCSVNLQMCLIDIVLPISVESFWLTVLVLTPKLK